ncbi:conserved protein of unknown function [Tenacibaculum sp. 190524A02b]|uniref:Lipoprotein n=1 Tax=Tenacibaculum vairaonense TaxID=3137860 RepID=A0ABP1F9D1_9FLAO
MRYLEKFTKLFLRITIISILLLSCSENKKQAKKVIVKKVGMDIPNTYKINHLDKLSTEKIQSWKEYFDLADFMSIYEKTSAKEALNNALELKSLIKKAKDSNDINILKTAAFKARINVFENEILRLADMTYIPAIKAQQVNGQIQNIFNTYNSLNSKISSIYKKELFDKAVKIDDVFKKVE